MKLGELRYASNLLSLSRIVLVLPIYYFLKQNTPEASYIAVLFMLLAAATDALDGKLARKLGQKSDLGRILDPLADKVGIAIVAILLVKLRGLPLWFFWFAVLRDVAILLAGLLLTLRVKVVVESNMVGKVTVNALAVVILLYTLNLQSVGIVFLWISVGMLVVSSISYFSKLLRLLQTDKAAPQQR